MNASHVKDSLVALLGGEKPDAGRTVLVTGPWGCGKTFLWQRSVAPILRRSQIYVSAFGAEGLEQLKTRLVTQALMNGAGAAGKALRFPALPRKGSDAGRKQGEGLVRATVTTSVKHLLSNVQLDPVELTGLLDPATIICIDDIERSAPSLSMESLLGLANLLSEHKKFDVVLICNEDKIPEGDESRQAAYRRHKEKTVTHQIALRTAVSDAFDQVLADTVKRPASKDRAMAGRPLIVETFERSKSQNLRQLARVFSNLDLYVNASGEGIDDGRLRLLCAMTLSQAHEPLQSADFYRFNNMSVRLSLNLDRKAPPTVASRQVAFLESYYGEFDYVFDQAVYDLVCNGFVTPESIKDAAPKVPPSTPLGAALKRASGHAWMYMDDVGVKRVLDELCSALVADSSAPASALLEGLALARLLAETVGANLPPHLTPAVTERLRVLGLGGDSSLNPSWHIYASTLAERVSEERDLFAESAEEGARLAARRLVEERVARGELHELARVVDQTHGDGLRHLILELLPERMLAKRKSHAEGFLFLTHAVIERIPLVLHTWPDLAPSFDAFVNRLREIENDEAEDRMDRWRAREVLSRVRRATPSTSSAAH